MTPGTRVRTRTPIGPYPAGLLGVIDKPGSNGFAWAVLLDGRDRPTCFDEWELEVIGA